MPMELPYNSKLIFKGIIGSHSYGLATEKSDVDFTGVYIQDEKDILSNKYVEMVQVNPDEKYFEIRKFLELLAVANPNAMELLYLPEECIKVCEPEFNYLMVIRDNFLTKRCGATFSGYARTQLRKAKGLGKKLNWEKHKTVRKGILDFCRVVDRYNGKSYPMKKWLEDSTYTQEKLGLTSLKGFRDSYKVFGDYLGNYRGIVSENDTNEPRLSEIPKSDLPYWMGVMYFNREAYSTHCKDYKEYLKWLKARNENRYVTNKAHGQVFDGKNILHTVRLIMTAEYIAKKGTVNIDMTDNRDFLLSIKKGSVNLEEVIKEWTSRAEKIDILFENSTLPNSLPNNFITNVEYKLRKYFL